MKKRKKLQKEAKKQATFYGRLKSPLSIGCPAVFISGGAIHRTSPVAAIHHMGNEDIHFETKDAHYHLILKPYPAGAIIPMHMGQAMAA